ncbi:MAG: hypothetical protein QXO00_02470 [Candidatus Bathyarchaeia archaeon]
MAEKKPEEEPITKEELETPIEKLVARKAEELYKSETGKTWKEEPPDEKTAEEYVRRAGKLILLKWLKGAKQYVKVAETVFGAPPERRMLLVKYDKKVELLPMEEIVKPEKVPYTATLQCPFCKAISMKVLVPGVWQCKNCWRTINTLAWFPRRRR